MGSERDRHRILADYLFKDLSAEEMTEVEEMISSQQEWSEAHEMNLEVRNYLQAKLQLEEMRSDPMLEDAERLADLAFDAEVNEPGMMDPRPQPRKKRTRSLILVASLAASLALILFLGILPQRVNEARLYDRFYEPLAAAGLNQRSLPLEAYKELELGIGLYLEGKYQQSLENLELLESNPLILPEVYLYSALASLELERYPAAQARFEALLAEGSRYQAEALWYLSLSCLKTGAWEMADASLGRLESLEGMYQKDARELRRKVRRLKP